MATTEFEFIFVTDEVAGPGDQRIEAVSDHFDIVVETHCGVTLATVTAEGNDATSAGINAANVLRQCGLEVKRTYPDLVSRQDIADRVNMSRQAVSNWTRGDRHESDPFPSPSSLVGGGAWLWSDVVSWLDRNTEHREDIAFPSFEDHVRVDAAVVSPPRRTVGIVRTSAQMVFAPSVTSPRFPWGDADSSQRDYSLAS